MKNLLLTTIVAGFAVAPAAAQQTGGGQIVGQVTPLCAVTDMFDEIEFSPETMLAGASLADSFSIQCNDVDGATLKLTSSEGGMESDDDEDQVVPYRATIDGTSFTGLVLDTAVLTAAAGQGSNGANDIEAELSAGGSAGLATGESGFIVVELTGSASWAGGYSDTLTLQITSN